MQLDRQNGLFFRVSCCWKAFMCGAWAAQVHKVTTEKEVKLSKIDLRDFDCLLKALRGIKQISHFNFLSKQRGPIPLKNYTA